MGNCITVIFKCYKISFSQDALTQEFIVQLRVFINSSRFSILSASMIQTRFFYFKDSMFKVNFKNIEIISTVLY